MLFRSGIGISVLLVALILMGVLTDDEDAAKWIFFGIGAVIFIVVLLYTIYDFNWLGGYAGTDWINWIILAIIVAAAVVFVVLGGKKRTVPSGG